MYTECDKSDMKTKKLFESEFAKYGDLAHYVEQKSGSIEDNLNEIVSMANQVLKGLIILHDKGYSHNDIKPNNLLIVERVCKKASDSLEKSALRDIGQQSSLSESEESGKNQHKTAMKIGDFGAKTSICNTHVKDIFVNKHFSPPDVYNLSPSAVKGRDIYSLGASLLYFMIGGKKVSYHKVCKELVSKGAEKFYESYNLGNRYRNKEKTIEFLKIISEMVKTSYKDRIELKVAQEKIKAFKSSLK